MNNISEEKRGYLKAVIFLLLIMFLVIYGILMYFKYAAPKSSINNQLSPSVVFTQPVLQFFSYRTSLNVYPDSITIHYPYLVVIRPDVWKSEIYNMESKKKEKEVKEILLDYYKGNAVYNKQGYQTYYNKTNLGILCDRAFIKSTNEILCITRPDSNKIDNKLISINPQTLAQYPVYSSENTLTAIYFNGGNTYIGEYNFDAKKAFITVNNKSISIKDLVNIIYPMQSKVYAGSFKSERNNYTESYSEITFSGNKIAVIRVIQNKIIFY